MKNIDQEKRIMAYNEILTMYDAKSDRVMLIEDYGPVNGIFVEAWRKYHFPKTSTLVERSYREGSKSIFILKPGKVELDLIPSFSPIGISECKVNKKTISIVYEGLGGGGVSASYSRGLAKGVIKRQVIQQAGGKIRGKGKIITPKNGFLLVGVDDTDDNVRGATYSLVHNISNELNSNTIRYMTHGNIQLYPYNPHKTSNCFSTVVGFMYSQESDKNHIINHFKTQLKKYTFSDQTAMAVYDGFYLPSKLVDIAYSLKFHFFDDYEKIASIGKECGVQIFPITGNRGIIGAVGALGLWNNPEFASSLPENYLHPIYL